MENNLYDQKGNQLCQYFLKLQKQQQYIQMWSDVTHSFFSLRSWFWKEFVSDSSIKTSVLILPQLTCNDSQEFPLPEVRSNLLTFLSVLAAFQHRTNDCSDNETFTNPRHSDGKEGLPVAASALT